MTVALRTKRGFVRSSYAFTSGFTLLELVITLVLIGLLSVIATSRFQGRSGFDTFAIQGQILSSLRQMQFRAMQDTRPTYCHKLIFDTAAPAVGPPSNDYSATPSAAAATCANTIGIDVSDYLTVSTALFNEVGASVTASDDTNSILWMDFDSLGRPLTPTDNCANGCRVTVSAQSSSSVCINREGYIRAC